MTAQELWQTALERLREHLPPTAASNWIAETAALSLVDNVLIVATKTMAPMLYLGHRHQDILNATLAAIVGRPIQVEYVSHLSLARLFETGKIPPDLPPSRVAHDLDVAKILVLIEEKEGSYVACAPDVPQSYVIGDSREEVLQRLRKVIQEQLSPLYEEHVPASLPHITAEYLDLTHSE
jgi:predicted RNase H-like HicB family nuclease